MSLLIVPDKEIMDCHVNCDPNRLGTKALNAIINVKSLTGCDIAVPSQVKNRLFRSMTDDHKAAFRATFEVDCSTENLPGYDAYTAYHHLVPFLGKNPAQTVLFVAEDHSLYSAAMPPAGNGQNVIFVSADKLVIAATHLISFSNAVGPMFDATEGERLFLRLLKKAERSLI